MLLGFLLGVGKSEEDVRVLADQAVVHLFLHVGGSTREAHLIELDLALAHLIITEGVLVLDLAGQFHVLLIEKIQKAVKG